MAKIEASHGLGTVAQVQWHLVQEQQQLNCLKFCLNRGVLLRLPIETSY